jgi:hypothetical protein
VVAAAVAGLYAMICIYIYTMASSAPPQYAHTFHKTMSQHHR